MTETKAAPLTCYVYRSRKRLGTYVYLRERDGFSLLPPALASGLGALDFAMELELGPERKLATQDVEKVIQNLLDAGFHVQFPPNESLWIPRWGIS